MPATSKAQQALMGMALSVKRGEKKLSEMPDGVRDKLKSMMRSMSDRTLKEFASTQTKGLPRRVGGATHRQAKLGRARSM